MSVEGVSQKSLLAKREHGNKYHVDGYDIKLDNKNDSHAIIVNAAKNANNVLDVGCGAGYIGKSLRGLGIKKIDGIEIDAEARKYAKKIYDIVYDFPVGMDDNSAKYKNFLDSRDNYDCIIFADILEHLVNPGQVLADFSKKMSKDGKMIVSIPNIANADVVIDLINQEFNYTKTGILDSTHLRFFTENSFYDFIDNLNEAYNLHLQAKLLSHTFARNNSEQNDIFIRLFGDESYIFQNIFEITQVSSPRQPKKKKHNYKKLITYITDLEEAYQKLEKDYKNTILELQKRDKIIADLYNSTSWKITAPLRKVSKATRKEHNEKN